MSIDTISTITSAFLVLIVAKVISIALVRGRRKGLQYPPGPPPRFIVGNALDFPTAEPGLVFAKWGKTYNSDILYANALGTDIVIINNRAIAEELFEKRAKLYNDRPRIPVVDLIGWGYNFGLVRYGEAWRQHRKLSEQHFNATAARQYQPVQVERVHQFLRGILSEPEKIFVHNKMLSMSLMLLLMYGYEPKSLEDPIIHLAEETFLLSMPLLSGGTLLNLIPILRYIPYWMPGASTQKIAKQAKDMTEEVKRLPREHVEKAMREGTAAPSLVTSFLEKKATEGASDQESEVVNNVAWTTYGAASDTTINVTTAFLHIMLTHPDIQIKAQAEIDRIVGNDRLPEFSDRESLPYIEAIYREVMRYRPIMGVGIAHALMEDDVYDNYFIPKGTNLIGNIWAMTHDESIYSKPYKFIPERFFNDDGKLNDDSRILAYGFGRRVCVGQHVASATLFMMMVSFLACFDIKPATDEQGNSIEIDSEYEDFFLISQKKPFKCSITPRSEQIRRLVEATAHK